MYCDVPRDGFMVHVSPWEWERVSPKKNIRHFSEGQHHNQWFIFAGFRTNHLVLGPWKLCAFIVHFQYIYIYKGSHKPLNEWKMTGQVIVDSHCLIRLAEYSQLLNWSQLSRQMKETALQICGTEKDIKLYIPERGGDCIYLRTGKFFVLRVLIFMTWTHLGSPQKDPRIHAPVFFSLSFFHLFQWGH